MSPLGSPLRSSLCPTWLRGLVHSAPRSSPLDSPRRPLLGFAVSPLGSPQCLRRAPRAAPHFAPHFAPRCSPLRSPLRSALFPTWLAAPIYARAGTMPSRLFLADWGCRSPDRSVLWSTIAHGCLNVLGALDTTCGLDFLHFSPPDFFVENSPKSVEVLRATPHISL